MKNLRPETLGILDRVEVLSGRHVEFKPDSSLTLRTTLQMARNGAPAHILRYRPNANEPIDYFVAYQAAFVLRLMELPPHDRYDFAGTGQGAAQVATLLETGQALNAADQALVPQVCDMMLQWSLMNLRSYAVGMRIDQWLADKHPSLGDLQALGMDEMQQENLLLLSKRIGNLAIPVPLLAPVAAYASFADRLLGKTHYSIPYRAAGVRALGLDLLKLSDSIGSDPNNDRELVDAWAKSIGMSTWYSWIPYKP